ncbi:MAG: phosphoadenosine phosphosulfate reductase family protein [Methanothrix sp.]|nr:phosphoadenosine phosphosulfate reductase family protein [Methanothrix sp.]OYV11174.1 MAG: phosphoadenosine phosphosulfate reductase [Methanosaeta sp. ASM2]
MPKTFTPGKSELFWCDQCNLPLLSDECSACKSPGRKIEISPPGDIRLCSERGRDILLKLFDEVYGCSDFLEGRIILLNKIAGLDRRDQVILDGRHIATLWFDVPSESFRLDLEPWGAALLANRANKGLVTCDERALKGHIKGKWLAEEAIIRGPARLQEGDNLVLRIGKFSAVGVARQRADGRMSIRIKDVTKSSFIHSEKRPAIQDAVAANVNQLKALERAALSEIKSYLSRNRLPVNVSFSGGKDSLACLCLAEKVISRPEILFINTGLEFPETVNYVREIAESRKLRLKEIKAESSFFEQVEIFGPPAKDYRWCCKTNKLGPMTDFLKRNYPKGCVTIEGRRIYESFNRSTIRSVERNPYVPGQTTLAPIRSWRALEVMFYIYWKDIEPNPLYQEDFERIGCWLCPAALQSEFAALKATHPMLYQRWKAWLYDWAGENNLDHRYIDWGFWRWKKHPPKIRELATEHNIDLVLGTFGKDEVQLRAVRGRSPCGLEYSIEATLSSPQNHPFASVAGALPILGEVKYAEELGAAVVETDRGRISVFANGQIMIIAGKDEAEELLQSVCRTILRSQFCTRCKICEKNCPRGAISVSDAISIDGNKCDRCQKCAKGCIADERARRIMAGIAQKPKSPLGDWNRDGSIRE